MIKVLKWNFFQIISGHFLPKPNRAEEGEVIDPYVSVKVWGHPLDAKKQKTKWINNNGKLQHFPTNWVSLFLYLL